MSTKPLDRPLSTQLHLGGRPASTAVTRAILVLIATSLCASQTIVFAQEACPAPVSDSQDGSEAQSNNSPADNGDLSDVDIDTYFSPTVENQGSAQSAAGTETVADQNDGSHAAASPSGADGNGSNDRNANFRFSNLSVVVGNDVSSDPLFSGIVLPRVPTASDPIDLANADKLHVQVDYVSRGAGILRMARVYHSNGGINTARVSVPMGSGWHMFYDRSLGLAQAANGTIVLNRQNGRAFNFTYNGSAWTAAMPAGVLTPLAGGWQYVNDNNGIEVYDGNGRLLTLSDAGIVSTMHYDGSGRLQSVSNPFGRSLSFGYDGSNRVSTVTLPDGATLGYGYDSYNNLVSARFTDNSVRQYLYENATFRNALTGITDESGRRRLTWGYDAQGRPSSGYYGTGTNAVGVVYNGSQVTTTDARGTQRVRNFVATTGDPAVASLVTAATADSAATSWSFNTSSNNGNPLSTTTRSGEVVQQAADARGRITGITRGSGTAQAITATTVWHPIFRTPTQTVAFGVTRTMTVDGSGRVTKIVKSSGGTAVTQMSRVFNSLGLLQSITDERGATTSFTYDGAGNTSTMTDPNGKISTYDQYNANGQVGRIQRADGTVISRTFDGRYRTATLNVSGATTQFSYDAAGRVSQVTNADGSWHSYGYDTGGYLTSIANQRGETTTVQRDATGAEIGRSTYTSGGALAQTYKVQLNAVGHLASIIDANNNTAQLLYGSDGRLSAVTDPLGRTRSQQLDVLNRTSTIIVPNTTAARNAGGPATLNVTHTYDANNNHKAVTDTHYVATGYSVDAFNHRNAEANNDAGSSTATRNSVGDVISTVDPRNISLAYGHDALGRLTNVSYANAVQRSYVYVPNRTDGLLASISDTSGSIAWTYDSQGRMLTQQQSTSGVQRNLTISRDSLGRPYSITYPSGMVEGINYSADLVSSITVNGSTLLSNITYLPDSNTPTGWTWGNGSHYSRNFDTDGKITSVTLGSVTRSYGYDAAHRITSETDTGSAGTKHYTIGYDEANQLIQFNSPTVSQSFTYDANGNRLTDTTNASSHTYTYQTGSNRMLQSSLYGTLVYNADGSPYSNGTWSYTYDYYGRLAQASSSTYHVLNYFNGMGQRVQKTVQYYTTCGTPQVVPTGHSQQAKTPVTTPSTTCNNWPTMDIVRYVYGPEGNAIGEYGTYSGHNEETIWFAGTPVSSVQSGTVYYIYPDNLGTPRSVARASDNVELWRWDANPFGENAPTNPNPASGTVRMDLRFPGQIFDSETALMYNGAREYIPMTGRYLEPDPSGLRGGLARYTYANADPLGSSDPNGLQTVAIGVGGSFVGGTGVEGSGGVYVNFGQKDAGGYLSGGTGYGLNVSGSVYFDFVSGDVSNFASPFTNVNLVLGPVSVTNHYSDGTWQGFAVGMGPGLPAGQASVTNTNTVAYGLQKFFKWLKSSCQ